MEATAGSSVGRLGAGKLGKDRVKVKKKTLQAVLEQCQRALELLSEDEPCGGDDDDGDDDDDDDDGSGHGRENKGDGSASCDKEADELCDLLKSRVECPDFLEKIQTAQMSLSQHFVDEGSSWDIVCEHDLWEDDVDSPHEYVLVGQEDIVEGIACFMATYLLSIKETKDISPNQLQDALSKTFSMKKKKGKLRKAWDGSKVIYNVASWGATAIGIYQNPAILRVATAAFWTSCHVISKLF